MNCRDYNCNQGRDCPARKAPTQSVDLSRVQLQGAQACDRPPSTKARLAKRTAQWFGALAVVAIWLLACAITEQPTPTPTKTQPPHTAKVTT